MNMQKLNTAMILSAGFGTRLKPLTDTTPKALIPCKGKPMIENVINKLTAEGITNIVINTHYLSEMVEEYFRKNKFQADIKLIHENEILGTGGGIKNAAPYLKSADDFLVYNVDVDSGINISSMYEHHKKQNNFVTLAIKQRRTERPLLFDENLNLIGNKNKDGEYVYTSYTGKQQHFGFTGIHVISSDLFNSISEEGFFDIFRVYFRLIKQGAAKITGYDIGETGWKDLGTIENLS